MAKLSLAQLAQLSLESNLAFCRVMADDAWSDPCIHAFRANLVDPMLNVVMDAKLDESNIDVRIKAVIAFYQRQKVDWYWIVGPLSTPTTLAQHLLSHDFKLIEDYPSLYFDLHEAIPADAHTRLNIIEQNADSDLRDWAICLSESFHTSDQAESYRCLNLGLVDRGVLRHFVGYVDDQVACAGTLFINEDTVVLHNIATRPLFRRRGLASMMTQYLMRHAQILGVQYCFLDAAGEAVGVYEKIGFRECARSQLYSLKK